MASQQSHDPAAVLRIPAFRWFAVSRVTSATARTLLGAAIAWQVYEISDSALQLGMIGLVGFVPALLASLVGGAVADAYNRRRIVLISQVAPLVAAVALVLATESGQIGLLLLYLVVFFTGLASSFENPARQALLPALVPRDLFATAITVNSVLQTLAFISGPTVGAGLIAIMGVSSAYMAFGVLIAISTFCIFMIRADNTTQSATRVTVAAIVEGIAFVWQRQILLGAMALDMFAVVFGGAKALLPIYAKDILEVGPVGYGILASSLEVGALSTSLVMILMPPIRRTGAALLWSVAAFGIATIAFGLSRNFVLSVIAYMAVGMADQISVVMRATTIQLATPDALRGRVTAVNAVFVSTSNQLGSVESGLVAAATSATVAVVSGGIGCLVTVGWIATAMPALRRYRTDEDAEAQANAAGEPGTAAAG